MSELLIGTVLIIAIVLLGELVIALFIVGCLPLKAAPTAKGKVAPHEGREIDLVLNGTKPLATIELAKDPKQYLLVDHHDATGELCADFHYTGQLKGMVIFTLPENKHLIDEYKNLVYEGDKYIGREEYQRRMGRLFGYSEADIEEFINGGFVCDCIQCNGMSRGNDNA